MEHWHFIGIGGAGMSVLAHALRDQAATVSGSDLQESAALDALRARGVHITVGHRADNPDLPAATTVVITAAVAPDNPELQAAQARGIPVIKRAALLGRLMADRTGVAIAGTHGKTTTTAMVAFILREAGRDPAFLVGGVLRDLGTGGYWGRGPELVVEADEYDRSFWQLHPRVAVITNVEAEHLDIYGDLAGVQAGFRGFAANVQPGGTLFCCGDDPGAAALARELAAAWPAGDRTVLLYGTGAACAWRAEDRGLAPGGGSTFEAYFQNELLTQVSLRLPGAHNVLNGLAALATAVCCGVAPAVAADALSRFNGTGRRFERKGEAGGVLIVDDYAHHPTEIAATLAAARRHYPDRRLVAAFQPHTYSRTKAFLPEFGQALSAADVVVVTDEIYAAREHDTLGVRGIHILDYITRPIPAYAGTNLDIVGTLLLDNVLQPGDLLLTLGAGDISKVGEQVLKVLGAEC
jgi:UDP-N-acetylmuramate--alanine ligase